MPHARAIRRENLSRTTCDDTRDFSEPDMLPRTSEQPLDQGRGPHSSPRELSDAVNPGSPGALPPCRRRSPTGGNNPALARPDIAAYAALTHAATYGRRIHTPCTPRRRRWDPQGVTKPASPPLTRCAAQARPIYVDAAGIPPLGPYTSQKSHVTVVEPHHDGRDTPKFTHLNHGPNRHLDTDTGRTAPGQTRPWQGTRRTVTYRSWHAQAQTGTATDTLGHMP
ncbi:hypothetical protein GCM10020220_005910 [Nonomuraea rubra]